MRHNPIQPSAAELRQLAKLAQGVTDDLDHVVAAVKAAGVTIDDEVYQAAAMIRAWSSRLAARAAQAGSQPEA